MNSINVKISSNIARQSLNKSKSYANALKSHHIDDSTAINTTPINIGKQRIEQRGQDKIAEKKSNPGKLNSEKLRKIYINFIEEEKEYIRFGNYIRI